jgi:alkylated DNA repair dioxygenase AlkB
VREQSVESTYGDVVDLTRYPIHDLDGQEGQDLVGTCRDELVANGACSLAGFLTPAAIDTMVGLATSLVAEAWVSDQAHTVYFEPVDETVGPDDPRARQVRSAKRGVAYDYIPPDAPVRRLYESDDMTRFVAAVLGKQLLYRSADPLDALQITLFQEGDELGWHFDRSEFSVTLMYQQSEEGGHFEYVPGLRSDADAGYPLVQQVLQGVGGTTRLPGDPGTLALFRGHHALHRVTPVRGPRPRVNSVLTYGERPDMRLNDLTSELFYGRTSRV